MTREKIECEICYEDYFYKKQIIHCHQCKKQICSCCFFKYIIRMKNIINYKCPFCRYEPNIIKLASMINKLDKDLNMRELIKLTLMTEKIQVHHNEDIWIITL